MASLTKLQEKLNSYYENSKGKLGENSELLKEVVNILGNVGYSHLKRVEKSKKIYDSLNEPQKNCFDQLLRINKNYVKTTSRAREIKNVYDVRQGIASLRIGIRTKNLERNIESNEEQLPTETIKINSYSQNNQRNKENVSYYRKAGSFLVKGLVGLGVAATIAIGSGLFGNYLGEESQQPKMQEQEAVIKGSKQRDEIYRAALGMKNKEIEMQKEAIVLAGRPDEEIREEARQNITQELTTKYEEIIESVNQIAQKQVDELLNQQKEKDLEQKLISAGIPDEEVRKNPIAVNEFDDSKKEYEILKEENERLKEDCEALKNENIQVADFIDTNTHVPVIPVVSSPVVNSTVVSSVVDSNFIEEETWSRDKQKYLQPAQIEHSLAVSTVNSSWENRIGMLEERLESAEPISKKHCDCSTMGFEERAYLTYNFMGYPNKIGKNAKGHWEDKKIVPALCSSAGAIVATANDGVEYVIVKPAAGIFRGLLGGFSRALGNKKEGLKYGWEHGNRFGASLMDDLPGGETKNNFDSNLLKLKVKKAFDVPYCMENTKTKGDIKLGGTIISNIITFLGDKIFGHHGGHHDASGGGITREGGELGSGGISSGGGALR